MINLLLSLYGTLCAVGYMGISVFLGLVSVFLFVCSVVVVAQVLERFLGHASPSQLGTSHGSYSY